MKKIRNSPTTNSRIMLILIGGPGILTLHYLKHCADLQNLLEVSSLLFYLYMAYSESTAWENVDSLVLWVLFWFFFILKDFVGRNGPWSYMVMHMHSLVHTMTLHHKLSVNTLHSLSVMTWYPSFLVFPSSKYPFPWLVYKWQGY